MNHHLLLMVQKSGVYQLRLVVCLIIYKVLYIPGGAGFHPLTVDLPYSLKVHLGWSIAILR